MVEHLETMTAREAMEGIVEVKAARRIWEEELAERLDALTQADSGERRGRAALPMRDTREELGSLIALQEVLASANKLNELRVRAGAKARPLGTLPFGALEDALHERLRSLNS